MGTKQNPGAFDCYANAKPDEPMFILLARDPQAPKLVELWAQERLLFGEDHAKLQEALDCANNMRAWHIRDQMAKQREINEQTAFKYQSIWKCKFCGKTKYLDRLGGGKYGNCIA